MCRTPSAGLSRYLAVAVLLAAGCAHGASHKSNAPAPVPVADASLSAVFYSDSSCLLTIDSVAQSGKTIIDADVDDAGSRMLIHCDTDDGRRLTLLARGDSLNVAQRVPLLTREEIQEGELGMIAWLTRIGVHYADDSAPRRYVIAGNVLLRKSPPVDAAGNALHSQRHAFGSINGILEPILKSDSKAIVETIPKAIDEQEQDVTNDLPADEEKNGKETEQDALDGQSGAAKDTTEIQTTAHYLVESVTN